MFLTYTQRPTLLLGLLFFSCSLDEPSFYVPDGFISAAYNCEMIQQLSAPVCGDVQYPVNCAWWLDTGDPPFVYPVQSTANAVSTCDMGLSAAFRLAESEGLRCFVVNTLDGSSEPCESLDTGGPSSCELTFWCEPAGWR
jgi:hypothetical protein